MTATKLLTAEDLWEMPEVPGKRFELVNGELQEVPGAGFLHGLIAGAVYRLLFDFVAAHQLGIVVHDGTSYVLRRKPDIVRIPDVSFVGMARLQTSGVPEGFFDGPPDLAVEVVSPNDLAGDIEAKVSEYLEAGTQLVWVVWPRLESVTIHTPDRTARRLSQDETLDGSDVMSGFSVRVSKLFAVNPMR